MIGFWMLNKRVIRFENAAISVKIIDRNALFFYTSEYLKIIRKIARFYQPLSNSKVVHKELIEKIQRNMLIVY
jgi:hypothetical protein